MKRFKLESAVHTPDPWVQIGSVVTNFVFVRNDANNKFLVVYQFDLETDIKRATYIEMPFIPVLCDILKANPQIVNSIFTIGIKKKGESVCQFITDPNTFETRLCLFPKNSN